MRSLNRKISPSMVVYKEKPEKKPKYEITSDFSEGKIRETAVYLPLHTGTHVDYPLHVIEHGKSSSDFSCFPIVLKTYVVDFTDRLQKGFTSKDFEQYDFSGVDAVFLKTMNSPEMYFDPEFGYLSEDGAQFLSCFSLKFVGTDRLGIERTQPGHPTHHILLEKEILILEGLELSEISQGIHHFLVNSIGLEEVEAEPVVIIEISE